MSASDETMMAPPPMPSSPAKNPVAAPIARYAASSGIEPLADEAPLGSGDRRDRQAVAALERDHRRELGVAAHLLQGHEARLLLELHVHEHPARLLALRLRVVVRALAVELARVGIGRA